MVQEEYAVTQTYACMRACTNLQVRLGPVRQQGRVRLQGPKHARVHISIGTHTHEDDRSFLCCVHVLQMPEALMLKGFGQG